MITQLLATQAVTIVAAADPGTMVNNALAMLRNLGVPLIILASSSHIITKVIGKQFSVGVLARTAVIGCLAVALFLLLPTLAESVTGVGQTVTGGNAGVR